MRRLGQELGVEAMSLYTHVRNKDDLLDGMVEVVVARSRRRPGGDWKASLRGVLGARGVLLRHPWAPRVIATRAAPGPAMLRYFDTVIGILRGGGFSLDLTHHALHLLGSRVLGFTQDLFDDSAELTRRRRALAAQLARVPARRRDGPRSNPRRWPRRLRRRRRVPVRARRHPRRARASSPGGLILAALGVVPCLMSQEHKETT